MSVISFSAVKLPWGFFGNMAPYSIKYMDQEWKTSEALFQALRFNDDEIRELIRIQKSPMAAKMMAKKYRHKLICIPMSDEDVQNMQKVIRLKFDSHPEIRTKLIESGHQLIVEDIGNRNGERHLFWGMKKIDHNWIGNNMMGKLLMELRESYQND